MLLKHRQRDYITVVAMAQELLDIHNVKYGEELAENQENSIKKLNDRIKKSFIEDNNVEDLDLYNLLLYKISKDDNIEDVVKLLNIGCPVSPVGNIHVHALKLAIDLDRPRIATALIAVGADVFFRIHNCDLLKYIWKLPETTICLKMIITRMYDHRLRLEKNKVKYKKDLDEIVNEILQSLNKNPENADDRVKRIRSKSKALDSLLCEAVEAKCPFIASFLHNAGAKTYNLNDEGKNAIHQTLEANTEMEEMLLIHLGGSLYVADKKGQKPADIIKNKTLKMKLEEKLAKADFTKLENSLSSSKDNEKVKKFALLIACLYASSRNSEDTIPWKELYSYTSNLLSDTTYMKEKLDNEENTSSEDDDFYKKDDRLTWVHRLCLKLTRNLEYNGLIDQQEYDQVGFNELIECLLLTKNKITGLSEEKYKIQEKNKELILPIQNCKDILKQALEYTCTKRSNIFLHLLMSHTGLDTEGFLDDILKTRSLHYAAANGKQRTVAYLILTCGVTIDAVDRNGNNAVHYAYMNGKIETGNYIIEKEKKLKQMKNSSGRTPSDLLDAYNKRVSKLDPKPIQKEHKRELEEKLQVVCEQFNEIELTKVHMDLCMLRRKIQKSTFKDLALRQLVDYNEGENYTIYKEVVNFVNEICRDIGKNNKYLQGTVVPAGSAADDCRLGDPEESDFNLVLDWEELTLKLVEMPSDQKQWKGYNKRIVLDSNNQHIKQLLSGSNLIDGFYDAVKEVIRKFLNFRNPQLSVVLPGVKKTGVGVNLTLAWMGTDHKLLLVDVDLVPVIKTTRPPEYPHPPLTAHLFVSPESVKHTIEVAGIKWNFSYEDLHAVYIHSIYNNCWRFSQALEENYVMRNLLNEDKKNVFLISKYIISMLKPETWYPDEFKRRYSYFNCKFFKLPAPQGFLLKSAFFKELERISNEEYWHPNYYLARVKSIFLHMCKGSRDRDCMLESLMPTKDIKVKTDALDCGKLKSYFACHTQRQSAGYLAAIILETLNAMNTYDFGS
ncbi:unnamed protein product [Meganyctiphanes norvegica]|uniref:Uncharacterized protein n=1 Tax=Meganyctiphanes norvegica TaxID=48144 RepID=A0AAV2RA23_MEGNR